MDIKVNRDILYFEETNNKTIKNLPIQRDAPLHNKKYQNRGYPYSLFAKGVLTVEAAFCATAFFLVLFSMLYLFQMVVKQNQMQMSLAKAAGQYETYGTKVGTIEGWQREHIWIHWEEEQGICYAEQSFELPFLGGRWFRLWVYQQQRIHAYDGKSMVSRDECAEGYVYVAERGKVYHKKRDCVYLNPNIQSIAFGTVDQKRNSSGGKYDACKSCCKEVQLLGNSIIYITPYGDSYHSNIRCPGLKRTVRMLELSKIGNMPPCSKCANERAIERR